MEGRIKKDDLSNSLKTEIEKIPSIEASLGESTTILIPQNGSTANAILLNIATLQNGKKYSFKATSNSTGAVTINSKPFKKLDGTQIGNGGIKANKVYDFYYDSVANSVFILAKATGTATPSDVLAGKTFSNDDGEQIGTYNDAILSVGDSSLLIYSDVSRGVIGSSDGTAFKKLIEVKINYKGAVRVKFTAESIQYINYGEAQIYVNGVPRGILRTLGSLTTYTEDITVNKSDLIQVYVRTTYFNNNVRITSYSITTDSSPLIESIL